MSGLGDEPLDPGNDSPLGFQTGDERVARDEHAQPQRHELDSSCRRRRLAGDQIKQTCRFLLRKPKHWNKGQLNIFLYQTVLINTTGSSAEVFSYLSALTLNNFR